MYRIQLDEFEGPLDLLLFFIRRDEIDIYDIPIADITDEYLGYIELLEEIDLDSAAEFIYVAALLISIKARMLLPRTESDDDEEADDPRRELVERLLEYVRYKEAAQQLTVYQERRENFFERGAANAVDVELPETDAEPAYQLSVFQLISALQRVLKNVELPQTHPVKPEKYTIEEQANFVLDELERQHRISFVDLVATKTRSFIIATFLALLELAKSQQVLLKGSANPYDFFLEKAA